MSDRVRIYVNGRAIDVPPGASVLDAIEALNPAEAAAVRHGEKAITDSRGLPAEPGALVYQGAIFRLVTARGAGNESGES